jgi:hypothetical protein
MCITIVTQKGMMMAINTFKGEGKEQWALHRENNNDVYTRKRTIIFMQWKDQQSLHRENNNDLHAGKRTMIFAQGNEQWSLWKFSKGIVWFIEVEKNNNL